MQKLAHSRSEAASDVDIAAAALSPGSSGDLNFSSNDAGGAQVKEEEWQVLSSCQRRPAKITYAFSLELYWSDV